MTRHPAYLLATVAGVGALALGPLWGCGDNKPGGMASWTVQQDGIAR
jgi:hypothetical protein